MNRPASIPVSRGERGSAYLIALLALVVLTILGLALVLITQTEVAIGANDRTINRDFYTADAGATVPYKKFMFSEAETPKFSLNDVKTGPGSIGDTVTPAPAPPLLAQCCNYCTCEEQTDDMLEVSLATTATAQRLVTDTLGNTTPQGEKTVSILMDAWPTQASQLKLLKPIQDPTALQKVKW